MSNVKWVWNETCKNLSTIVFNWCFKLRGLKSGGCFNVILLQQFPSNVLIYLISVLNNTLLNNAWVLSFRFCLFSTGEIPWTLLFVGVKLNAFDDWRKLITRRFCLSLLMQCGKAGMHKRLMFSKLDIRWCQESVHARFQCDCSMW